MKNIFNLITALIIVIASCYSCIQYIDDPDTKVIQIANGTSTYIDEQSNYWSVKNALIYSNKPELLMYPIQYDSIIVPGMMIRYHCHLVTEYNDGKKFIKIDWESTKRKI